MTPTTARNEPRHDPGPDPARSRRIGVAATADGTAPGGQPHDLLGTVAGDKVELPPLHGPTEVRGALPNPDPSARRLGVAVVGLGHLALGQILRFSERNQFALEMDAFAEAIRGNTLVRTPGEEGLQDMRLIEAIYQAAEGGSPVRLQAVRGRDITRGPMPARGG